MKRFILAPDSFKGTMSAGEICTIMAAAIRKYLPSAHITSVPLADGGEGMVEALVTISGGDYAQADVSGPYGELLTATYALLPDQTAVVELASCCGLPLVGENKNPALTSTVGLGELILAAARRGAKKIIVGLGGSASNDCGLGLATAFGYRFLDKNGNEIEPIGQNMAAVEKIVPPAALPDLDIIAACDVDNPLFGPRGAAYTFAPQKGADPALVEFLDFGLEHMARIIKQDLGRDVAALPGAGAAGGLGAAVVAFLGGAIRSGIDLVLDAANFDQLLVDADLVFTGEGRLDWQSIYGKVPIGVATRAKAKGVPVIALCGSLGPGAEAVYKHGITAVFSAIRTVTDFATLQQTCREDLRLLTEAVVRMIKAGCC